MGMYDHEIVEHETVTSVMSLISVTPKHFPPHQYMIDPPNKADSCFKTPPDKKKEYLIKISRDIEPSHPYLA